MSHLSFQEYCLAQQVQGTLRLSEITGDSNTLGSASLGYGIGNYFLYNGDNAKARSIFQKIVDGNQWSSFGYIAAEAELARMGMKRRDDIQKGVLDELI